ncbi:MAG: anaerobic sulfatase maturase [Clostridia bacterium]|nr:anaerobic sulfatase maturase [Clostridia bacterium]
MPPLTVMIKPASSLCNFRCAYCFYSDVSSRREVASYGVMNDDTLSRLVRRAFAYAEGSVNFTFQGGEPTLAGKAFFRRFLELVRSYDRGRVKVNLAIQTNGWLIDREWCELFREGRFLVGVSLDGSRETHDACRLSAQGEGTWDRVTENLCLLRKNDVEYNVLCVVNRLIAERPRETFNALKPHGHVQFIPCLDGFDGETGPLSLDAASYGRFLTETFDLYEECILGGRPVSVRTFDNWLSMLMGYPPENCAMSGRCGRYFLVEADGGVYPCDFYVLDKWRLGNINEKTFRQLEASPLEQKFYEESVPLADKCRACRWLPLCRGGCKRDREPLCPDDPSVSRLCEGHRTFFESRYDRLEALARKIASKVQKSGIAN